MSFKWNYNKANFFLPNLQENQFARENSNSNYKLKGKAYLNPDIVNCGYFKWSLSKNHLQAGNKIHVNPNFRGNKLDGAAKKIHFLSNNFHHVHTQNESLGEPGPSNIISAGEIKSKPPLFENEKVNNEVINTYRSRFKKVNVIGSLKCKNSSQYSWSNGPSSDSPNASDVIKRMISKPIVKSLEEKHTHTSSENVYKYTSKNLLQITNKNCQKLNSKNFSVFKSKTKIINGSKAKILNSVSPKSKLNLKYKKVNLLTKRHLALSQFAYNNKISPIARVAKAVRTKYKYLNNTEQYKKSKYKIDKRNRFQETVKNKENGIKDIRKLFPNNFYNKVKSASYKIYYVDNCHVVTKRASSWRKNPMCDKSGHKIKNKFHNKRVVKIGGILYKSTTNKLTLASKSVASKVVIGKTKGKKNHIVHVRGEKFILENNGKALRRLTPNKKKKNPLYTVKRVDIGGVTYLQKSQNVLIRTNVHRARHLVNKAKNKSIALLANLHKKSSMPCMIYHKFGKCNRHMKDLCIYKHDSKNIALCKNFLKGNCLNKNCLLSHEVIQEKMATCHFFLNGLCVRENCPFLHVKLNKKVAICENFLQGFCNLGMDCPKRHFHQCPKFDKYGTCNLGYKCHYPHKKLHKAELTEKNVFKDSDNVNNENNENETVHNVCSDVQKKQRKKKLVFKTKENGVKKTQRKVEKRKVLCLNSSQEGDGIISCLPKRIRLDTLPCYIPLKSDS